MKLRMLLTPKYKAQPTKETEAKRRITTAARKNSTNLSRLLAVEMAMSRCIKNDKLAKKRSIIHFSVGNTAVGKICPNKKNTIPIPTDNPKVRTIILPLRDLLYQ